MRLWFVSSSVNSFLKRAHAQRSIGTRCLIFGRTLRLLPYFMCANNEGSGETRGCAGSPAFAGRLCDKYHNHMSWLICRSPSSFQKPLDHSKSNFMWDLHGIKAVSFFFFFQMVWAMRPRWLPCPYMLKPLKICIYFFKTNWPKIMKLGIQ